MTNADLFRSIFNGLTATELWAKPESEFLEWLNAEAITKEYIKEQDNVMENNPVHLCNSCCNSYPECFDDKHPVGFGDGIGNDNICCCNKYEPLMEHDYERSGYKMTVPELLNGGRKHE